MRLHRIKTEYEGRVMLRTRFFPLELLRGEGPPRDILEQEWWLASLQEPAALFTPYSSDDFPTTTLPAFDAVWAARRQGDDIAIGDGTRLRLPIAYPTIKERRIVAMAPLQCCGDGCTDAMRSLFERALASAGDSPQMPAS